MWQLLEAVQSAHILGDTVWQSLEAVQSAQILGDAMCGSRWKLCSLHKYWEMLCVAVAGSCAVCTHTGRRYVWQSLEAVQSAQKHRYMLQHIV